jgi:hypothetical protein
LPLLSLLWRRRCIHRRRHHHERRFHRCRCRLRVDCCIPRCCLCFRRHR